MISAEELRLGQKNAAEEWSKQAMDHCEIIGKDLEKHIKNINSHKSFDYIICRGKIKRKDEHGNLTDFFDLDMAIYVTNILKQNGYTVNCVYEKTNYNGKYTICW
jgi:hypothetical protein